MNTAFPNTQIANPRQGAMLPFVAVVMVILFVVATLGIDIARMHLTRAELRNATDAAAKAAAEALSREQNQAAAIAAAIAVANSNIVAGEPLELLPGDIEFGKASENPDGSFTFVSSVNPPFNSIRVLGDRTRNPVKTLFGHMIGVSEFRPSMVASTQILDRDIGIVLDVSGSMRSDGKFEALGLALEAFLSELENNNFEDRVSLTVYSTHGRKVLDLTTDLASIRDAFANESPGGFTAIGEGMNIGRDSVLNDPLARPFALKTLLVMTDGIQNRGVDARVIAERCDRDNVVVNTVTFSDGANQSLMQECADITDGIHMHADDNDDLVFIFREIARQLPSLLIE